MTADFFLSLQTKNVGYWFKRDYQQSKTLFDSYCQALTAYDWQERSWPLPTGPALFTNAIWIGDCNAQHVVVLLSGTHGVEGYCGSAAQSYLLNCLQQGWLILP